MGHWTIVILGFHVLARYYEHFHVLARYYEDRSKLQLSLLNTTYATRELTYPTLCWTSPCGPPYDLPAPGHFSQGSTCLPSWTPLSLPPPIPSLTKFSLPSLIPSLTKFSLLSISQCLPSACALTWVFSLTTASLLPLRHECYPVYQGPTFTVKGQINSLGFGGPTASVSTTQHWHWSTKAARDDA